MSSKPQVIFFGNGPLADYTLAVLKPRCNIIFHAKTSADLEQVKELKAKNKEAHGILASFGVMIKKDVLDLFEPEGILNLHPSLLPEYRGASPIETAILSGATTFGISVMKLVKAMDAGPLYYQTSVELDKSTSKDQIYQTLAEKGAAWLAENLEGLPEPQPQQGEPTFTEKLDKSLSPLDPSKKSAEQLSDQVRAFANYPKSKYEFYGLDCTIISAHVAVSDENTSKTLSIQCYDKSVLIIDEIQPAGRKIMDAKSFLNGYAK